MSISIALATCNGGAYLRHQLQSFLDQSRPPDEVVISDDASDDNTVDVVWSVLSDAPFPVRVVANTRRLGVAGNFSRTLGLCQGDIVALSDQDDVWFPQKLKRLETVFRRRGDLAVLVNDAVITDARLVPIGRTRIEQSRRGHYCLDLLVQGSCTTLRRSLLQQLLPVPSHVWTHDNWIHAVARLLDSRAVLEESLQYFRRHANNGSTSPTSNPRPLTRRGSIVGKVRRNIAHPMSRQAMIDEEYARLQSLLSWWHQNARDLTGLPYVEMGQAAANVKLLQKKADVCHQRSEMMQGSRVRRVRRMGSIYAKAGIKSYGGRTELIKDLLIR